MLAKEDKYSCIPLAEKRERRTLSFGTRGCQGEIILIFFKEEKLQ